MSELETVIKSRRSANKFVTGVEISDKDLDEIFQLAKFAPSAFNLQHTHYMVIREPELKQKVYEAANKQYKILTSSAVIVVLGRLDAYHEVGKINEGLLNLGVINKQEFDLEVESVTSFYEAGGDAFKRDEAVRNASLSAMQMMLIAKDQGWDTCPMIGFNPEALRNALSIPESSIPVMLVSIGKEDTSSQRPRGYRKPVAEFVTYM
ncbi:putative NAD(P)H nitroreductase MhqN [compost metagenome]